jgi:chromosome segregation ATPase
LFRDAADHVNMEQVQVRHPRPSPVPTIKATLLTHLKSQRAEAIHMLDLKYHGAMHQTDLIVKDEEARRLKLRVIVLRDEVAVMRDQLEEKEDKIRDLSQQYDNVTEKVTQMNQICKHQEEQLRLRAQQQSDLKVLPLTLILLIMHESCVLIYRRPSYKH